MSDEITEIKPDLNKTSQEQNLATVALPAEIVSGFNYIQSINWKEKLDNLDQSFDTVEGQLQTLLLSEQCNQISEEEVGSYLIKIIEKKAALLETGVKMERHKLQESPDDVFLKSQTDLKVALSEGYNAELKKMREDQRYTTEFFNQFKHNVNSAKERVIHQTKEIDQGLEQFFHVYRQGPGVPLVGRIIPLTEVEYRNYMIHKFGKVGDIAHDMAQTSGQTSFPESQQPRGAVVKLNTNISLRDSNMPSSGITLHIDSNSALNYAAHESVHLITDLTHAEEAVETTDGLRIIDKRGFRERYLDKETGKYVQLSRLESELPLEALDEGTVVFFQRYIAYGQDLQKVIESLDKPYQRLSQSYIQSAKAIAQLVQEIGIASVASNYINSTPAEFLKEVRSKLGDHRTDQFIQDLQQAQQNIRN